MDKKIEQIMVQIKNEMGEVPRPLELLSELDPRAFQEQINNKKMIYSQETINPKYKAFIALGVGVALGSSNCILNNTKAAIKAGASKAEVMEALSVAKFSTSASTLSSSLSALEWLKEHEES